MAEIQQVIFSLDNSEYGIDIVNINEIVRLQEITKMPNSLAYLDGIINLRGRVTPIIDLRLKLNLPPGEKDQDTRIIVVTIDAKMVGMVVDRVLEVMRINEEQIENTSDVALAISDNFVKGIAKIDGTRLVTLLDIASIFDEH